MTTDRPLPLDGIRVLDCSRVLAGPFATMLLGDLGAEVIKLEAPDGDETRRWGPPYWGDPADGISAYFATVNRNKRSVVVDLKTDAGRGVLDRLAERSDLLVHNLRPSTVERLGLADARLAERHPRLVVVSIGGYPGSAADRERPAYDLLAQAVSGVMAVTGEPDGEPMKVGVAMLDLLAGLEAAVGALAALVGRGRHQPAARRIEVSLVEVGVASLVNVLGNHLVSGREPERYGNAHPNIAPYQAFAARDGHLVVAVGTDPQFRRLLEVLGLEDAEGRYATNAARLGARGELVAWLGAAIAERGRDELLAALAAVDVPAGPVASVPEALAAMERAHPEGWVEAAGEMRLAPDPILLDGERLRARHPPPRLGEQTAEILAEAGLSGGEIAALRAAGVVA